MIEWPKSYGRQSAGAALPHSPPWLLYSFTRHLSCIGMNFRRPFQETETGTKTPCDFQIPHKASLLHLVPQPHTHTDSSLKTNFFPHLVQAVWAQLAPIPPWWAQVPMSPAMPITAFLAGEGRKPFQVRDDSNTPHLCLNSWFWGCFQRSQAADPLLGCPYPAAPLEQIPFALAA